MTFTTRPELLGQHGVIASTHWLGSQAGMAAYALGGTAADAAVAAGLVLQVVEPQMSGPAGDMPALVREPSGAVSVICGQGVAPAAMTMDHFARAGLAAIPGTGLLPATVPGAFDAWLVLLQRWGRLRLREVLAPAIRLAGEGFPISPHLAATLAVVAPMFGEHWPSSAALWLAGGGAPQAGDRWRLPGLAATYARIVAIAEGDGRRSREQEIEAARLAWHEGFVAEAIGEFCRSTEVWDGSSEPHRGLLTADDIAGWRASVEAPVSASYAGWTVYKPGPWSQGPVMLQQLMLLRGFPIAELDPTGAEFVHVVAECAKLAFADREAWYGDPDFTDVPVADLLSPAYADERRALVGAEASAALTPGRPGGRAPLMPTYRVLADDRSYGYLGGGEPTMQTWPTGQTRGDTCHIDAIDASGLSVSATPSGGWLQSSPAIPALGFPLGTRGQMFWLDAAVTGRLRPGARPRTTLSPSLAVHEDGRVMPFGTPGGDQQDQWALHFFLRYVHGAPDLQAAIDMPAFHSEHMPGSFWPRSARPRRLVVEDRFPAQTIRQLGEIGHDLLLAGPWSLGRLSAALRDADSGGWLRAAANPRGMLGYANAW